MYTGDYIYTNNCESVLSSSSIKMTLFCTYTGG